ncbi:Glycyl-tRNA synthetase beta chain [Methylophaga frappieri]|uniref:Glycine--tRNA ligase beta subunit n=1 Tax=Methylophaga frappieri (strain ATCC BAA-2434 / DSM 25690 / JAM7) TaxID=754477 RepID=I1YK85_METFJ|nr:glycine--tRNA ligase subunit beta [Methylophaga frappieri]AFJ03328.1 Glycyl-tRNA synthetase beta chain [Methylophaga frappieri]
MSQQDFLFELGTEELPPTTLQKLSKALLQAVEQGLKAAELAFSETHVYAAPRRLAVTVFDLQTRQADRQVERRGPAVAAAFDEEGQPTKALQGFAKSCNTRIDALETLETDKGKWLVYRQQESGLPATVLLPQIMQQALDALPIAKRMRWGNSDAEFVRPVHWLVMLLGDVVVPATLLDTEADRVSYGHRFHFPDAIRIDSARSYAAQLANTGYVIADFAERRDKVRQQVVRLAEELGGEAIIDADLLDEVTGLVEWPVAIAGSFDERFLSLPAQALISSMQGHQKYFPVQNQAGELLANFITVSNIESQDTAQVIAGNERVIRPRLSDAAFFWDTDRKQPLASRQEQLKSIVFQHQLGSIYDKSQRVASLASHIAQHMAADAALAKRAAELAKCDLVTEMVGEFPELQGIMGRQYALLDGEQEAVATALDAQYMPRFAGDDLPADAIGQSVSLAEKLDTLVGLFGIGQPPSGTKDPFALRRAALGVLRILIEKQRDLDLGDLLTTAVAGLTDKLTEKNTAQQVQHYLFERLRGYVLDNGHTADAFDAVLALAPSRPLDFMQRLEAVKYFRQLPESGALAAANKRIDNILRKNDAVDVIQPVQAVLLEEAAEQKLASVVAETTTAVAAMGNDYQQILQTLATLQAPIDQFFDEVMVMADDDAVRQNRLALLNQIRTLFLGVADISCLQQ